MVGSPSPRLLAIALFGACAMRLIALGALPILDPSEGRYVAIAATMEQGGDWVTPRFPDGTPYWGKPPLYFWLTAAALHVAGHREAAARVPAALGEGLLLLATWLVARRLYGPATGLLAALVLASSALVLGAAGVALLDVTLAACVTWACTGFLFAVHEEDPARSRSWGLVFFAGLGLGMLAKGPVALVLCALAIGLWSLFCGSLEWIRRLPLASGAALFLALAAPWYALAERRTPGFLEYFLLQENLLRYVTRDYGDLYGNPHVRAFGTVWTYLLAGSLPWSPLGLAFLWVQRPWRFRSWARLASRERFLVAWAIAAPLFFTFGRSVLWGYVLPSLPPLAALFARLVSRTEAHGVTLAVRPEPATWLARRGLALTGWVILAAAASAVAVGAASGLGTPLDLLAMGGVLAGLGAWRLRANPTLVGHAAWVAVAVCVLEVSGRFLFWDELAATRSTFSVVKALEQRPELLECNTIYCGTVPPSVSFYDHEHRSWEGLHCATEALRDRVEEAGCEVVVVDDDDLERIAADDRGGLREIYADPRRRILTNAYEALQVPGGSGPGIPARHPGGKLGAT
jgi:4-amino-4-deoxy-L-arabinose transferase-like glycosyltransferase